MTEHPRRGKHGEDEPTRVAQGRRGLVSLAIRIAAGVVVFLGFALVLLVGVGAIAAVAYTLFRT